MKVLDAQSCPTLCDPIDCISPGSSVYGVLQARILQLVATASSRGSSWPRDWTCVSCIADRFFTGQATTWLCLVTQSCLTLCDPMDCSLPGSSVNGGSPGKNTGLIFLTQGSNRGLLHCRQILYHLSHQGSPRGKPFKNLSKIIAFSLWLETNY